MNSNQNYTKKGDILEFTFSDFQQIWDQRSLESCDRSLIIYYIFPRCLFFISLLIYCIVYLLSNIFVMKFLKNRSAVSIFTQPHPPKPRDQFRNVIF